MPRYSVPEDLEITNKEKKNYNGCNGLAGSERALKWDRVPPLQWYGHLLEQAGGLIIIIVIIIIIISRSPLVPLVIEPIIVVAFVSSSSCYRYKKVLHTTPIHIRDDAEFPALTSKQVGKNIY